MTRRLATGAVALLLLFSVFTGVAIAAENNSTNTTTTTAPTTAPTDAPSTDGYTLEELKQDGKHYSVPGARIVPDEDRVYWLEHTPANQPWKEVTKENNGPKFGSGQVLKTNTLYLRTIRAQTDSDEVNVTIVSWQQKSRQVTTGNTTVEEQYAANVTTQTQQVNLGPGWAMGEVVLPRHEDTTRVTMWIEGQEDTARWTFQHRSVATTQPIAINTWGDFLYKIALYVGLPVLIGGAYSGKKVRNAVESAAIGPQWGFGKWAVVISIATVAIAWYFYVQLAQAIVYVPFLMGFWMVAIFAAYTLATHRGDITYKGFLKPHIRDAASFTNLDFDDEGAEDVATDGGEVTEIFGHEITHGEFKQLPTITDGEGVSIVRPGFVPFLARVYGARSKIENLPNLRQRFKLPDSVPDEIFFVDPDAETLVEYEPPGFTIDWPELGREQALMAAAVIAVAGGLVYQLAAQYGSLVYAGAGVVGAYVFAKRFVVPTDGYARVNPAPMHFRQAFASMLMLQHGVRDAKDLDEAKKMARREKMKTKKEAQDELDEFDRIMMDFLAGGEVEDAFDEVGGNGQKPPGADEETQEVDQ